VWSSHKCKQAGPGTGDPVPAEDVEKDTGAPVYREGDHLPDYPQLSRRKRKLRSSLNRVYDTDDPDGRNTKQPRPQLVTTVTCYGIDGGSWRIGDDGLEFLGGM
jgi:hypothetical protein